MRWAAHTSEKLPRPILFLAAELSNFMTGESERQRGASCAAIDLIVLSGGAFSTAPNRRASQSGHGGA